MLQYWVYKIWKDSHNKLMFDKYNTLGISSPITLIS